MSNDFPHVPASRSGPHATQIGGYGTPKEPEKLRKSVLQCYPRRSTIPAARRAHAGLVIEAHHRQSRVMAGERAGEGTWSNCVTSQTRASTSPLFPSPIARAEDDGVEGRRQREREKKKVVMHVRRLCRGRSTSLHPSIQRRRLRARSASQCRVRPQAQNGSSGWDRGRRPRKTLESCLRRGERLRVSSIATATTFFLYTGFVK